MSCKPKRLLTLAALCAVLAVPVSGAEVDSGGTYVFCSADFSEDISPLAGVCITELPQPSHGIVRLGDRVIRSGDILTASQLEQMTFSPVSSREDSTALVKFLPIYPDHVAGEASVTISIRGKEDKAPVAEDSGMETYKNLPNEAVLKVSDPEGQQLVYTLVRSPKRGEVILREDGSFLYTPKKNKVGTDSFTYTASDPAGNVSREATVTIKILKPTDSLQYADTAGLDCRFAAEWMRNTGIFSGESVSGQVCFSPEKEVSRGQFLAMLMETLELPVDRSASETGFLDESPDWLKPYLAAALRSGIISGYPCEGGTEFRPGQTITGQEAATMVQNALNFAIPTVCESDGLIAAWAREASAAVEGSGIAIPQGTRKLTRADAAQVLYSVSKVSDTSLAPAFFQ